MPELDEVVFGECQAQLFNSEDILREVFGLSASLVNNLALAIQFSQLRDPAQVRSMQELRQSLEGDILEYVDRFRSSLTADVAASMNYSYRVFLIPKTVNRESSSDVAVEFVKIDLSSTEDQARRDAIAALIKPTVVQVANAGTLTAGQVCKLVEQELKSSLGPDVKFTASSHHARAWKFYKIRPERGAENPAQTKTQYCHFDVAHNDYVYTHQWVKFLINEFRKAGQFDRVLAYRG